MYNGKYFEPIGLLDRSYCWGNAPYR